MTIQERYDALKAEATTLGQQMHQTRSQLMQLEQQAIRADAQMALLEALLTEQSAPAPLTLVVPEPEAL